MKPGIFFAALFVLLASAGCDKPVCDCQPFPNGDTLTVNINQKKSIYSCCADHSTLAFSSVKEDSRCPEGFNCLLMYPVWAGTAKVVVKLNNQPVQLEIGIPKTVYNGYTYTLQLTDLLPKPKSGLPTDPNSYQARILVKRE